MPRVFVIAPSDSRPFYVLRWLDPKTRRWRQESTKTTNLKAATRAAGKKEDDLLNDRIVTPSLVTWAEARERYEEEELPNLAHRTAEPKAAVMNHVENILHPHLLSEIDEDRLSQFQAALRKAKLAETTIAGHLAHLGGFLAWCERLKLIAKAPKVQRPKVARLAKGKTRFMKGRPLVGEEYDRIIAAAALCRPLDADAWKYYLEGLWLSGLRLSESIALSWDSDAPFSVDASGKRPRFKIHSAAQKSREDEFLPMVPEFWTFLERTPAEKRVGRVFQLDSLLTGEPVTPKTIIKQVSRFGEKANVIVNKAEGKFASAHDLRRSFGTRWAMKVMPIVLQRLMRHKSIETTLRYYVTIDADNLADKLWTDYLRDGSGLASGQQKQTRDCDDSCDGGVSGDNQSTSHVARKDNTT